MNVVTRDDVIRMNQALVQLHEESGCFLNECGHQPSQPSIATKELSAFREPEFIKTVYAQGTVLIEVAADHLVAFTRTITEPVQTMAPWTCVRAIIESSALASWLFDPGIDVRTRVQRSFAFRYEGLRQQEKFGRVSGNEDDVKKAIKQRIDVVEAAALKLGFNQVKSGRGKRIGIAQQMPSVTRVVDEVLGEEATYRLLSAIAHAHPWALQQSSYRKSDSKDDLLLKKNLEPFAVAYLSIKAADSFSKPVWYKCQLFGWDVKRLELIFSSAYDSLGINPGRGRFWEHSKDG
jgi:hypothetical protein